MWLYTKHINLYEKFGWKYVSDIDTYNKEQKIQRLYKDDDINHHFVIVMIVFYIYKFIQIIWL